MGFSSKDYAFMADAEAFANNHSKDKSTKVGALIVKNDGTPLSWGYNGFPRGANDNDEKRHERPLKYLWTEHAERNAIYNAARSGIELAGSRLYVTTLISCPDCARAIIQAGIKTLFIQKKALDPANQKGKDWLAEWEFTKGMLQECGVEIVIEGEPDKFVEFMIRLNN